MTRSLLIFGAIFVFASGTAEPISTCEVPGSQCSGENEVYDCRKLSCKEDLCEKLTSKFRCNETEPCTPGCFCESGFFRESPGDPCKDSCSCNNMKYAPACAKQPSCEGSQCSGENEVYDCRKLSCKEDLCVKLTSKFRCNETEPCTPGCYCESGFFRESLGDPCKDSCSCNNMKYAPACSKKPSCEG